MSEINDDMDVSLLMKFCKGVMEIEDKKISLYIKENEKDLNLDKEKNRAFIINLCFDNIINSNNNMKNYRLVNILFEKGNINKTLFEQDKLINVLNIIIKYFESKKNKEESSNNKFDISNIKLIIRFLAKIYYLFSDKKDLIKFITKEIIKGKIIKDDKSPLIKEFIENKNNFEKQEFNIKEEAQFYILLFLEINHLDNKLEYIYNQNHYIIKKIGKEIKNILYIKEFWNIFNIQKNNEITDEMCDIIYQIYNITNKIKELIIKCKDIFNYNINGNNNIIHLLKYIIIQTEKNNVINIKPHYLLCKKSIIKINIEENKEENKELYFFGNSTINQIYNYLTMNSKNKNNIYYNENNTNEKEDLFKSLNEFDNKKLLKINKKEIERNNSILLNKGKLTEKFRKVLNNWFNFFSKGKDKMSRADLAECFNVLSGKKENKYTEKTFKICIFLKKNSDNYCFIILEKFINFFINSLLKGKEEKVWINIENMNLRNDLSEIPQIKDNKFLPRYYLSNKTEENKDLCFMDIIKEKYKNSLNEKIYDFLYFLSTDEKLYENILNNFNTDENMKFTKRQEEYLYNLYIMDIIKSILEDVEYIHNKNNKFKEIKVCDNDYYLYKPENNIELKNKFFIEFIKNNYNDLIEFAINNIEKINKIKNEDLQKQKLVIKLCRTTLKLIYRIYNYYHNTFSAKKEELTLGKNSLKEFIEENNLTKEINEQNNYNNLFTQLMKFLDIYYINDNKNYEILKTLCDTSFLLFISFLSKNNEILNDIKNNSESKELLDKIINYILIQDKQKNNKSYIRNIIQINSYTENALIYLIDMSFIILINLSDKKLEGLLPIYISTLFNKGINNENIKKYLKGKISSIFIKCVNDDSYYKKSGAFFQAFLKSFDNQIKIKNEIMEEKIENESLYDIIYKKFNKKEEDKLRKKYEKYEKLNKFLSDENNDNKFIKYDDVKNKIDELFTMEKEAPNNNNEQNKNNNNYLITYFKSYIITRINKNRKMILEIIKSLNKLIEIESKDYNNNIPDEENTKRKKTSPYIGIRNLGTLCYIGSILQQLFWIPKFRNSILSIDDLKPIDKSYKLTDDDNTLHQTQKLFTYMLFSSYGEIVPKNFIFSIQFFGERINVRQMLDSSEFYHNYCDIIQTSLENTKYKNLIEDIFVGKTKEKKTCSECGNITYKEEEFKEISLEVKDIKDIYESLDKYISEEIIDDYKCDKCNNKVKLKKTTVISSLPNILVVHLKRMTYNNNGELEKINNKFNFPFNDLNLKKYCLSLDNNENYYKYNLKGINIHKGNAEGGHYVSLIKVSQEKNKWYLFDDSFVSEYNIENFEEEFNKNEKDNSAYILFYESIQEKKIKTPNECLINKEYVLEVFNDNKIYECIFGDKIIDINNSLIKILLDLINNDSFNIKEQKLSYHEIKDLIDIFIQLIINYYSKENSRTNPEQNDIKNFINIINKIFIPIFKEEIINDSYKINFLKQINEKLCCDNNIKLIFTKNIIKEVNEKIYEIIHLLIEENKKDNNIFSKTEFQELLNKILEKEKNFTSYFFKILFEIISYYPNADLLEDDENTFLDLFYKAKEETNVENYEDISKIFDYYIKNKNIIEKSENIIKILKEDVNGIIVKLLFEGGKYALKIIIEKILYDNKELSDKFNMDYIQVLYTYCSNDKEKQIKLMKLIFDIIDIKDNYTYNRIKILLGFPNLIMKSNDIISEFGINLLNNDINKEIYEYSNYNLIKKERCVLSYLFPSLYNINDNKENKLEEKDKCDLIYDLINRALGLNNYEGNYFLFKTLFLMQARSIKFNNLYQEMKYILQNAKNEEYNLDLINEKEKEVIKFANYEIEKKKTKLKNKNIDNNMDDEDKVEIPEIYKRWEELIESKTNEEFIGCLSNIFPYEIGKIEITLTSEGKKLYVLKFKLYTTYFTKDELTTLSKENKPFSYENLKRSNQSNQINNNSSPNDKELILDFSIFEEKKDLKEFIIYIIEQLKKEKQKIIIENKELLNKYEVKNIINKYYVYNKDKEKKSIIKSQLSCGEMHLDEKVNFYLPEYIYNSIEENQVINLFNVYSLKKEYRFFESNDIGISIKCSSYDRYFKNIFE